LVRAAASSIANGSPSRRTGVGDRACAVGGHRESRDYLRGPLLEELDRGAAQQSGSRHVAADERQLERGHQKFLLVA
jgi:hypothetical protein